jgi:hypothetical protein
MSSALRSSSVRYHGHLPFDFRGRPLDELLDVEANVEKRSNGGPTMWDRLSQGRQGVLDVIALLISGESLELGPR